MIPLSMSLAHGYRFRYLYVADAKRAILGSIGMFGLLALVLGALAWIGVGLGFDLMVRHTRLFVRA
jgi:hypothetical protein